MLHSNDRIIKHKVGLAPNPKNRVETHVEAAVVQYATDEPAHGQVRVSNELRKKGIFVSPQRGTEHLATQ